MLLKNFKKAALEGTQHFVFLVVFSCEGGVCDAQYAAWWSNNKIKSSKQTNDWTNIKVWEWCRGRRMAAVCSAPAWRSKTTQLWEAAATQDAPPYPQSAMVPKLIINALSLKSRRTTRSPAFYSYRCLYVLMSQYSIIAQMTIYI